MELKATTAYDAYWKATSNGDNSIPVYRKSEADKVIARQKYKRCLKMAWYCEAMCGHYLSYEEPKWFWYRKWSERWLELAEKFKEAK